MKEATATAEVWFFFFFESLSTYFSTDTILFCCVILSTFIFWFCTVSEIPGRRWKNNIAHRSSLCCVYITVDHSPGLNLRMTFLLPDQAAGPCWQAGWPGMLPLSHCLCPRSQMWCLGVSFSSSWVILLWRPVHCVLWVFRHGYPVPSVNTHVVHHHNTCGREERGRGKFQTPFSTPFRSQHHFMFFLKFWNIFLKN